MNRRQLLGAALAAAAGSTIAPSLLAQGTQPTTNPAEPTPSRLPRWRGFNLFEMFHPEWSEGTFRESDFDWIAEWGFDFIRLPLSYWFWAKPEAMLEIDEAVLTRVDDAVRWGGERGMHVSLNMHRIPGYCVNPPAEPTSIADDPATLAAAQHHWAMFAERYKGIPNTRLSFDLMNEPANFDTPTYLRIHRALAEAIRAIDPSRLIVADGNQWGNEVVPGVIDLGLAASTRGYQPMQISHFRASWIGGSDTWEVPTWPLKIDGQTRDKAWLRQHYEPWRQAAANGLGVHVGEWGSHNRTPHDVALAWMGDCLDLYRAFGWGWGLWNFRGSFGILDSERDDVEYEEFRGHKLDRRMLELLRAG